MSEWGVVITAVDEMPPRIFNSNVSNEILLGYIHKMVIKETDEFGAMESARIEAQMDDIEGQMGILEQRLARATAETKVTVEEQIEELKAARVSCEARSTALLNGLSIFKGLSQLQIDLADADNARKNLTDQPTARACETLTVDTTYTVVKLESSPENEEAKTGCVPLIFKL